MLERKQVEIDIAQAAAKKRVVESQRHRRIHRNINESLISQYLQHEAIEAHKAMVNSPNHPTIYILVGSMGVPLVERLQHAGK
jgi:hypothetical protein